MGRRLPSRGSLARAGALVLLAAPAVLPLLGLDWFESHEGASYPARIVEVARCWEGGMLSARWFPDLAGGRGYPFLSFYAPLSFWTAAAFHVALGLSVAGGLKAAIALAQLAAVAGGYRLAREGLGRSASFAATALWAYAPYRLRDLWTRGDVAEWFALGLFPWAVWGVLRLARRAGPRDAILAGALGAVTILSHNVVALITGLSMAGTAVVAWAGRARDVPRAGRRIARAVAGAGALALLLSAFFWAPALAEKRWVQLDNLRSGYFEVGRHWIGIDDLLAFERPPRVPTPGRAEPMTFGLGLVVVPMLFAPLAWRGSPRGRRRLLVLGAALLLGGIVLATRLAAPLYEAVPWLRFVGLPWRFLGPASLGAALLAGAGVEGALGRGRALPRAAAAATIAVAAVATTADLIGPTAPLALDPWMLDPASYRAADFTASAADEYRPIWATHDEAIPFRDGVAATGPARITGVERGVGRWRFRIDAEAPVGVVLRDWFYPGWAATADGAALDVAPRAGSGHVQIRAPAGAHEIRARLEPLPVRRAARWISALAAVGAIALLLFSRARARGVA